MEIEFDKEKINFEEELYTKEIENLILESHNLDIIDRKLRFLIDDKKHLEVDVVLNTKTINKGMLRLVGIELKESDLAKAVSQACVRRKYFNYFYIVINRSVRSIVGWLFNDHNLFNTVKVYGIGIISTIDNVVVLQSKFFSVFTLKYLNIIVGEE